MELGVGCGICTANSQTGRVLEDGEWPGFFRTLGGAAV